jgi:hypothetical protein
MEVTTMRRNSFTSDSARRALGVAGIAGFVALALCSNAQAERIEVEIHYDKAVVSLAGAGQRQGD